jgi:hypothetical protein
MINVDWEYIDRVCKRAGLATFGVQWDPDWRVIQGSARRGELAIKEARWLDRRAEYPRSYNAPQITKENTFQDLVAWDLWVLNRELVVTINEGDSVCGRWMGMRCAWSIDMNVPVTIPLEAMIMRELDKALTSAAPRAWEKLEAKRCSDQTAAILASYKE